MYSTKLIPDSLLNAVRGIITTPSKDSIGNEIKLGDNVNVSSGQYAGKYGIVTEFKTSGTVSVQLNKGRHVSIPSNDLLSETAQTRTSVPNMLSEKFDFGSFGKKDKKDSKKSDKKENPFAKKGDKKKKSKDDGDDEESDNPFAKKKSKDDSDDDEDDDSDDDEKDDKKKKKSKGKDEIKINPKMNETKQYLKSILEAFKKRQEMEKIRPAKGDKKTSTKSKSPTKTNTENNF